MNRRRNPNPPLKDRSFSLAQIQVGRALGQVPPVVRKENHEGVFSDPLLIQFLNNLAGGLIQGRHGLQKRRSTPAPSFVPEPGRRGNRAMDGVESQIKKKRTPGVPFLNQSNGFLGQKVGGITLLLRRLPIAPPVELLGSWFHVGVVIHRSTQKPVVMIETAGGRKIFRAGQAVFPIAPQMPFATHPRLIARILKGLRKRLILEVQARKVLHPRSQGVHPGHQGCPGHTANGIHIEPVQPNPLLGQAI